MKQLSRLLALLLAICLSVSLLSSCGAEQKQTDGSAEPAPAGDEPEEEPEQEAAPEPASAAESYRTAAEHLGEATDLDMDITMTVSWSVGTFDIEEKTVREAKYRHIGSADFTACVSDLIELGNGRAIWEQLYREGIVYAKLKQARYFSRTDAGQFMEDQIPFVMLDPDRYPEIAAEEDGALLRFSGASEPEPWAVPEGAILSDCMGTVRLTEQGDISAYTYEVSYSFGGTDIRRFYEAALRPPESEAVSEEIPASTKGYESLDSISAALWVFRSAAVLETVPNVSSQKQLYVTSDAAGCLYVEQSEVSWYDGDSYLEKDAGNCYYMEYSDSSTESYGWEYTYADGQMTSTDDSGTDTYDFPEDTIRFLDSYGVTRYLPAYTDLTDAVVADLGEYWLISYTGTDPFGLALEDAAEDTIFPTSSTLDDVATAYITTRQEGYLAVEKDTCLPTAIGASYAGAHTIEGGQYGLTLTMNMSLGLLQPDTYETITGEPLPAEEPAEKASPLFYKVTGGSGETMYLFGTIHVGDDRTGCLPQGILRALEEADALAVEFDADSFYEDAEENEDLQELLAECYYYTDGTGITNHIDSELYRAAVPLMKASGQYSAALDSMKPFVWSSIIDNFYLSQGRHLSPGNGVDNRLMALAREQDKPILDVESGEFQIRLLSGYSDEVQEMLLAETVSSSRSRMLQSTYELYEMWCEGDEEALIAQLAAMTEEERSALDEDELKVYDEYNGKMLVERNHAMLEVAESYLQGGTTVFYAVGLAHLLGEDGLVDALRGAGYTVTLVDTHG